MERDEDFSIDDIVLDHSGGSGVDLELKPPLRGESTARSDEPLIFEITDTASPPGPAPSDSGSGAPITRPHNPNLSGEQQDREKRPRKRAKIHEEEGSK